jgi:hypothetical protein
MEIDILKSIINTFTLISPFLAAYLTYYFGIKRKSVEVDFEKKRELNIILADLLDIWYYLQKLRKTIELQKENDLPLPIPIKSIPYFMFQSNTLNEDCFKNLEQSVKNIKKYDAIIYYELEGIGKNLDYMRKTFILPFLKSNSDENIGNKIADFVSNDILNDLEKSILDIAEKLGKSTLKKAKEKVNKLKEPDSKEMKLDFIQEYHGFVKDLIPLSEEQKEEFTIENMVKVFEQPEIQLELKKQFEVMSKYKLEDVMNLVSINPNISAENMVKELEKIKPEQNTVENDNGS